MMCGWSIHSQVSTPRGNPTEIIVTGRKQATARQVNKPGHIALEHHLCPVSRVCVQVLVQSFPDPFLFSPLFDGSSHSFTRFHVSD